MTIKLIVTNDDRPDEVARIVRITRVDAPPHAAPLRELAAGETATFHIWPGAGVLVEDVERPAPATEPAPPPEAT